MIFKACQAVGALFEVSHHSFFFCTQAGCVSTARLIEV